MQRKTKVCTRCNKRKKVEQFHVRNKSPDGLCYGCKTCMSRYSAQAYLKKAKALRKKCKAYYAANKEKILKRQKEYSIANADKIREWRKAYYLNVLKPRRQSRRGKRNAKR